MNIILGASGQIGSTLVSELKKKGQPVRAVVRDVRRFTERAVETRQADMFNAEELTKACLGGTSIFVLTPETPTSDDIIEDTKRIIDNYKTAIRSAGIKKVVALSCIGAHLDGKTGNVLMSKMLEQELADIDVEKVYVRPSYYFSNWLAYLDTIRQSGVLPTFLPASLRMNMLSPVDVAKFTAEILSDPLPQDNKQIYELEGSELYSPADIAGTFSRLLNRPVRVEPIPKHRWLDTLLAVGFTENTAQHLVDMTQAVIENRLSPEHPEKTIKLQTTFGKYLQQYVPLPRSNE